eukprot:CAMPEP_0194148188 /NCGR_PEP_ID=MMETSP0152-20130528/30642_1 /TAXON_ID=1049557 /ORGANISM="Thalassiothrix antarctica, Strain L6-D1" /LENGTH=72 /DNA_ID=CAMNT_0038849551 /DNA_START=26 /DNA_END=241 /DNA_ORIENTATION=+
MSKCQYFVHGYSGMAEAVTYINYPLLHDQSVNIDDDKNKPTPKQFQKMILKTMGKEKKKKKISNNNKESMIK